jgi:Rab GDP dissociation inhibitor
MEAATTSLVGMFQKPKLKSFLEFIAKLEEGNPATYGGLDLSRVPMRAVFQKFNLNDTTCEFIGHAMALQLDEKFLIPTPFHPRRDPSLTHLLSSFSPSRYLDQPALPTCQQCKLYGLSVAVCGDSPYYYPKYGIGELGQAFARLSAVFGAVYILNKPVDELVFDAAGNVSGVRCGEDVCLPYVPSLFSSPRFSSLSLSLLVHFPYLSFLLTAPESPPCDHGPVILPDLLAQGWAARPRDLPPLPRREEHRQS